MLQDNFLRRGSRWRSGRVSGRLARAIPGGKRRVEDFGRFLGVSDARFEVTGLPAAYNGFLLEGIPFHGAAHSRQNRIRVPGSWLMDGMLDGFELITGRAVSEVVE